MRNGAGVWNDSDSLVMVNPISFFAIFAESLSAPSRTSTGSIGCFPPTSPFLLEFSSNGITVTLQGPSPAKVVFFLPKPDPSDEAETRYDDFLRYEEIVLTAADVDSVVQGTNDPNFWGESFVDTIGTVSLRLAKIADQNDCGCRRVPGEFLGTCGNPSSEQCYETLPDTFTLTIQDDSRRPTGMTFEGNWSPGNNMDTEYGSTYLPAGTVQNRFTVPSVGMVPPAGPLAGCDAFLPRFLQPIVMRRVVPYNNNSPQYQSDPIPFGPCVKARFTFTIGNRCNSSLSVSSVPSTSYPGAIGTSFIPGFSATARHPPCAWLKSYYQENPSDYADAFNEEVYAFGDGKILVTAGGTHTAEPALICPGETDPGWSYFSNCRGGECPPQEVIVRIEGPSDLSGFLGDYYVEVDNACRTAGGFLAQNFPKTTTFPNSLSIGFSLGHQPGVVFVGPGSKDACGCGTVGPHLKIDLTAPAGSVCSSNAWTIPENAGGAGQPWPSAACPQLCGNETDVVVPFGDISLQCFTSPSSFPLLGTVSVIIPAGA